MIDVHCHLNFKSFREDFDEVIKRAHEKGVTKIINVGTKLDSSEWAVHLAEEYENLYAIVGVHPHHADKLEDGWIEKLEEIASHPKVLAIGEIGLDYYSYQSNGIVDPKLQEKIFTAQIKLAHKLKLPLQIHNRHAGERVIEILTTHNALLLSQPGMFHCFAATREVHQKALSMGFSIGFDGNITYPGLAPGETISLSDLAKETPLERLVIETDSPYLTPIPHRGSRNEPAYAIIVAEYIAKLKSVTLETLVEQTDKNVYTIFGKLNMAQ